MEQEGEKKEQPTSPSSSCRTAVEVEDGCGTTLACLAMLAGLLVIAMLLL